MASLLQDLCSKQTLTLPLPLTLPLALTTQVASLLQDLCSKQTLCVTQQWVQRAVLAVSSRCTSAVLAVSSSVLAPSWR